MKSVKHWKTTLGGALLAAGACFQAADNPTMNGIGWILIGIGGLLAGVAAPDASSNARQ